MAKVLIELDIDNLTNSTDQADEVYAHIEELMNNGELDFEVVDEE